jgi:hypothetical protein
LAWLIKKNEKIVTKERAGKEISGIIVRQKRACIFSAKDIAKNVRGRAVPGKKSKKG